MSLFFRRLTALWIISLGVGIIIRWSLGPPFNGAASIWTPTNTLIIFTGIVLLASGLYLLFPLYRVPKGLMVNPPWMATFYDFISMLFGGAAAIMVVDLILLNIFGVPSNLYEEQLTFMSVFFLVIGIPILSAYTSRLGYQSIVVSAASVHITGPSGTTNILWTDVEKMELSDEYVIVGRMGTLIPRQLQKRLKITTKMGESYFINEPQLKGKKKEVINKIKVNLPKTLDDTYSQMLDDW